jgi:xylulokinase
MSILAVDLGGTSFRAALIDRQGGLASPIVALPAPAESRTTGEIDPAAWWDRLREAVEELAPADVEALAITGVTRTQVFLDQDGAPLRPAMTWRDARASEIAAEIADRWSEHPEAGAVNAFHPLARLAWLQRHEPDTLQALATVAEPKDYLNFRLTGARATDPISSARLLAAAAPGEKALSPLDALGLPGGVVPPVLEPAAFVGSVTPGLPGALGRLAGRPVVSVAHDTWACVVGLGALRDGFAYNISGTTEVLGLISSVPAHAEGLLSLPWGEGLHQLGGPSQSGADALAWALDLLSGPPAGAAPLAARLDDLLRAGRQEQPLLFLPYLQGERTPHWDPALRGAFVGLHRRHGPADCAHAVLEGVACLNRAVLERAEAAIGRAAQEIRFGGGGARSRLWAQVKADVCERPVVVTDAAEPGLLGAAITAWVALGAVPSLAAGQESLARVAERFEPDPDRRDAYRRIYELFRRSEEALAPISRALAALRM